MTSLSGHLLSNLLQFSRLLRRLGLDIPAGSMHGVAEALTLIDLGRRPDFYHTLRTLLVRRRQDLVVFDQAFHLFWRPLSSTNTRRDRGAADKRRGAAPPGTDIPSPAPSPNAENEREKGVLRLEQVAALSYSARHASRTKDFATFTDEEIAQAHAMLASLTWTPGQRRTRRWQAGHGPTIDMRRAIRQSLRHGEIVSLPRRQRRLHTRPLILLCDVSGSMERYSRMLLHFVHTLASGFSRVETFLFSTRLTRVTRQLEKRRVDNVIPSLPRHVPDWSGGTRIGDALRHFNITWARRVLERGPVVLLISDGWDRGDPNCLGTEMARLHRSSYRLIWLNPLLGSPRYQPLTRGMQAALPWIDDFLPVHNLASLDALATHLNRLPARRRTQPPEAASRRVAHHGRTSHLHL